MIDNLDTLPPEVVLALGQVDDKAVARAKEELGAGTHAVDAVIRLQGLISIGEAVAYTPTSEIPALLVLSLALERAGIQRENIERVVIEVMNEIIESSGSSTDYVEKLLEDESKAKLIQRMALLQKRFREGLTKKIRAGNTKANLSISALR